uniref:Uncharacterized protein n=1 Tax=Panagrolaimus davidi TaxID=227884 RepID=A0A914PXC4_9BILA
MFDSDDENAETFTGSTAAPEHLIPPTFNANRPLPPLQSWQLTNQRPPSTQRSQPRNPPRHVPWEQNRNIYIPEADEDPFYRFPDAIKLNGFIITNEISRIRHQDYSFMVFCQEDQSIYGIPRRLTTPPYGIKLNEEQRWRKKRDLEFGRKVDFVLGRFRGISAVEEYAKGPADSIIAENVEGKNCVSFS